MPVRRVNCVFANQTPGIGVPLLNLLFYNRQDESLSPIICITNESHLLTIPLKRDGKPDHHVDFSFIVEPDVVISLYNVCL